MSHFKWVEVFRGQHFSAINSSQMSHFWLVILNESYFSNIKRYNFSKIADSLNGWLKSKYKIPKKPSAVQNFDFESFQFDYQPIRFETKKPAKKTFCCKICTKKCPSRRSLQLHINRHHKLPCLQPNCKKMFWKNPKNPSQLNIAIMRHNFAVHFKNE